MFCTLFRRWRWMALWWPLTLAAAHAAPVTQFDHLVLTLQTSPAEWRLAFASLALSHLADAYYAEVGLARSSGLEAAPALSQENTRWSRSVEAYAHQLLFLKQDVEQATDVTILQTPASEVIIALHGTRMMLTHPRPGQQRAFEHALVEQFCQLHECDLAPVATTEPAAPPSADIRPDWLFTEDGTACRHQGLQVSFPRNSDMAALRQFCTALFSESELLLAELRKLQQFGMTIQWSSLTLAADHTLHLNARGDTLTLALPTFQHYPRLLPLLHTWLAERSQGRTATRSLSAAELPWP